MQVCIIRDSKFDIIVYEYSQKEKAVKGEMEMVVLDLIHLDEFDGLRAGQVREVYASGNGTSILVCAVPHDRRE